MRQRAAAILGFFFLFLAPAIAGADADGDVLYSQLDSPGGGFTDQDFETVYSAYDSEAADDFVVTDGPWSVGGVTTPGEGPGGSIHVDVTFYPNAGGEPGDTPIAGCEYLSLTDYTDSAGDLSIALDPPCALPDGHYWVAQQVRQDYLTSGYHLWSARELKTGEPAQWRNPRNGWSVGCIDWEPACTCFIAAACYPDLLFELTEPLGTTTTTATPAVGPFGLLMTVLALGGSSFYVLVRRRR
jgi:hypothetical protein